MFILTKIADLVQIKPAQFAKLSIDAIEDNLNEKYCNKVIQKVGLCICMYDLLWASEGLIGHGDGLVNVNVECRLVIFRPFKGEVLFGRISRCVKDGIHLRTDFFDDIFVPFDELPEGATFDHDQSLWVWHVEDQEMYYDIHEMVRFRVSSEEWQDQTPTKPIEGSELPEKKPPYRITGTMKEEGLGVCLWWGDDGGGVVEEEKVENGDMEVDE
ncbi:DNA-directed RNA polymerase III polypeptide [Pyricularia oryzae 70-15]|uniref:DNA-directed RNA polymerase subunit n=1 Tax=Pyricularia oryzae (strain 70-15 / ATCC MYA-4617 / FGSC 8958) TaxID=242507 RepID=G4MYW6_PYRO7|nr:DNA-directed RNA polymerase III polypeptide [Pyricularia oryzae 70-15]EHA53627.1 DNA-directed RNA polymerase III polypeptide [Pyricularia oryzae 70-15]KAI7919390.1 DNA-directed RNA polymerase III polypeptide [Pyricularia oryzae]KAI7926898.1 DNA-directed RNA polymerase III polypeptide [Pyricularia oryzae]